MQDFIKIGQMVVKISRFFNFHDDCRLQSYILGFEILKLLVTHQLRRANMHRRAKFHQNWSNVC